MAAPPLTVIDYLLQLAYVIQGLLICFGNGMLFLTIVSSKALNARKEMLIIALKAAVDFLYGVGTLLLGVYRGILMAQGVHTDLTTPWQCVILPPIFLSNISVQLMVIVNVVVSIDRYMAVAYPAKYRLMGISYAKKLVIGIISIGLVALIGLWAMVYFGMAYAPITPAFTRMCTNAVLPMWYPKCQTTAVALVGLLSVAIYANVFTAYRSAMKNVGQTSTQQATAQRKLTVTIEIITISTLLSFVLPYSINVAYSWMNASPPQSFLLGTLTRMSTIINIVIYVFRQNEIRRGMVRIVTCKMTAQNEVTAFSVGTH